MVSLISNPLPLGKYTTTRVVVYFYSGRWMPIMFCRLVEAIALHRKAMLEGKEIFVFPSEINPCELEQFLNSNVLHQMPLIKNIPLKLTASSGINVGLILLGAKEL